VEGENNEKMVDEEVLKILRDSLKMKLVEDKKLPNKVKLNKALIDTLSQFLECYRIMGYDLEGNPVNLFIHNNKMEESAMNNMFVQEFGKFMGQHVK
jgi:hypothetical protein